MSDDDIRRAHPDPGTRFDTCGCCDGIGYATPVATENRPNLPEVSFRSGGYGRHKSSMLAALSSADVAPHLPLGTRSDGDFSIALIDAWASTLEVLGFYQERLANEGFVDTATERLSLAELGRLVGYRLHPGAAAETDLVLLMDDPPGAVPDVTDLTVPAGTRVQSQPGPDETPQIFETLGDLTARVAWNRLVPRQTEAALPKSDSRDAWLAGTPGLAKGDMLLFLGADRWDTGADNFSETSGDWAVRRVVATAVEADGARTRVTWDAGLNSVGPEGLRLFVLRERASLFGFNAPAIRVLSEDQLKQFDFNPNSLPADWSFQLPFTGGLKIFQPGFEAIAVEINPDFEFPDFEIDPPSGGGGVGVGGGTLALIFTDTLDPGGPGPGGFDDGIAGDIEVVGPSPPAKEIIPLDAIYKSFVRDGWIVLATGSSTRRPYRILSAYDSGHSLYAISGRSTSIRPDTTEGLESFEDAYRATSVYGASEELAFAERARTDRVEGSEILLEYPAPDLPDGRILVVRGPRARVRVLADGLVLDDDSNTRAIAAGAELTLMAPPEPSGGSKVWQLMDADGFTGLATASEADFETVPAPETATPAAETVTLSQTETVDGPRTKLILSAALKNSYDRAGLSIHGNVARVAHGEGITEILGSGNPAEPFQAFLLGQAPVTHRLAATDTGVESTLIVRIDGVAWTELPDLYDRGPAAQVFRTTRTDAGETIVEFGDGLSGARPHPGRDNIVAEFSRGLGRAGNLRAGQLTMPLDRPLGLRETFNPVPATGGDDPETADDTRSSLPIYTLTLGRIVSIADYRDYALGFPGIAKAEARWVWDGTARRVVVTVAGDGGAEVPADSETHDTLLAAYRTLGDPLVSVDLLGYAPSRFSLGIRIKPDPARDSAAVLAETEAALRFAFRFEARDFAEPVELSEVAAAAHTVPGVLAVDIDRLYRETLHQTKKKAHDRLVALSGRRGTDGGLLPAEILTLSPAAFDKLELMP